GAVAALVRPDDDRLPATVRLLLDALQGQSLLLADGAQPRTQRLRVIRRHVQTTPGHGPVGTPQCSLRSVTVIPVAARGQVLQTGISQVTSRNTACVPGRDIDVRLSARCPPDTYARNGRCHNAYQETLAPRLRYASAGTRG